MAAHATALAPEFKVYLAPAFGCTQHHPTRKCRYSPDSDRPTVEELAAVVFPPLLLAAGKDAVLSPPPSAAWTSCCQTREWRL